MKDYIKNKLKRIEKYSVQGRGGHGGRSKDEQRAAQEAKNNRIQANADRVTATFSQLSPPFGADLLIGTAKLESVELLSDGPIKGFFDQDGKQTDVLGATYINDIPIVAKTERRVRHKDLKLNHCKGCQADYTTGVKRYLMDFRAYLSTGIGFSGRKHGFDLTNNYRDMAPGEMIFPTAKNYDMLYVARKDNLSYALAAGDRTHSIQFAANPGMNSAGSITSSFSKRKSNANEYTLSKYDPDRGSYNQGYRQSPYAQMSFYGQDQISSSSNFNIPSTNSYTNTRPLKYQGSIIAGGGLDPLNGKVESSFVTRAFYTVLQGFFSSDSNITKFETGYAEKVICDIRNVYDAKEWGKTTGVTGIRDYDNDTLSRPTRNRGNGTMGPFVGGDTPYITRHFNFHPGGEEPFGLIEPHISGIFNLLAELPNQREIKGYLFKQSHEHAYRAFGVECTGKMIPLTLGGRTNRNVMEFRGLDGINGIMDFSGHGNTGGTQYKGTVLGNSVHFGNENATGFYDEHAFFNVVMPGFGGIYNAGYFEKNAFHETALYGFQSGEKIRFTGSFYIPAGGKISGLLFESQQDTGKKLLDARSTMDQWVDFDFTNEDADASGLMRSNNGDYILRAADFSNNPENFAKWDNGTSGPIRPHDVFYMKNLSIIRADVTGELRGFNGGTSGYLIFPADCHTFATDGDEDSKIKKDYSLSFAFGSGDAVLLGGETLKYLLPDVDGFSGNEKSIRESIALEVDLQGEERDSRTSKLFNITGTTSAHNHVVNLEENRPTRFKGAVLYPVYLGEEGTALSGINDTHRLDSLSRVMIFPDDDHEVKQLKYQSGVQYNYDVFSGMENGGICYSHLANPNVITTVNSYDAGLDGNTRPTGHGYPIQIRLEEREPTSFNFPNVYVASRDGQEVQEPLLTMARTEIHKGVNLLGPYAFEQAEGVVNFNIAGYGHLLKINSTLSDMGPGGSLERSAFDIFDASLYLDQDSPSFSTGFLSIPSLSSADVEFDRSIDFNNWNEKPFTAADEVAVVHQITRSEVNSIAVVFQIDALSSEHIFEDDPDSPRVARDKASLHLEVEMGFEGVEDSVFPPQKVDITYEGVTKNTYSVETDDIRLPTYNELYNSLKLYPVKNVTEIKYRYVKFFGLEANSDITHKPLAIREIHLIDNEGISYPTSDFGAYTSLSEHDPGGNFYQGPFTDGGITVSSQTAAIALPQVNAFVSHQAFDGDETSMFKTDITENNTTFELLNYLLVDFGRAVSLSQIQISVDPDDHETPKILLQGSNTQDFSDVNDLHNLGSLNFDNATAINDLDGDTVTINIGTNVTVSPSKSIATTEVAYTTAELFTKDLFGRDQGLEDIESKYRRYVKVRKLDFETMSTRITRSVSCYSIIENVDCKFTYPFSALVQTELDARSFMDIPVRTFNTKLKKVLIPSNYFPLRVDGTDKRFIKDADSYQGDVKIYDGDWDGSFKFEWTDNPAWILYDLLTNNRYGIGNFIDDTEDINVFNLYKIARYCDAVNNDGYFVGIPDGIGGLEPRYSANILINQADAAFEIINQITAIFNGNAFWANGVLDFYSDKPAKPAAFFNNGNVFDGHFTYQDVSKSSNFNCVSVQFQDKNDDFKIKTEVVEDEDGIRKDGKLVRELNGRGTTSRGQARRLAKYVLYSNKLEREIVYFKAGLEVLMVNVGDIIEISDEVKQFKIDGARVLEVNANDPSIAIENTIDINSIDNEAFVYSPSGQTGKEEMYDEIRRGGLITNQRLSGMDAPQAEKLQISSAVPSGDNAIKLNFTNTSGQSVSLIRTGSFANINLTNNESQTFRVIRIVPDDEDNLYSVMATEYNSGKFNFIEGNDENFNLSETTPFNIGIPNHTIKELTEPNSFSFTQTQNNIGTFDLNFTINGELSGNEEIYLITVVYPNGVRKEKRVKKSSETSGGYFVTETSFRNLEVFGTYNVFVKSDS